MVIAVIVGLVLIVGGVIFLSSGNSIANELCNRDPDCKMGYLVPILLTGILLMGSGGIIVLGYMVWG